MLCYRCGSHVPDDSQTCPTCGQALGTGSLRQTTGTFSRRRLQSAVIEGAPYKPGDVISDRYAVKDTLAGGPIAFVFRCFDKDAEVEVALKSISPKLLQTAEERKAFQVQMRASRNLNHPNIARIYEDGEHADRPFFTTQFLDGLSLRKIIDLRKEKGQFFKLDEIEPILVQIGAALDEAHKQGLVHGDLRPENVLVLPDLLKITDFGLGAAMPAVPFVAAQKLRKGDRYFAPEFQGPGGVGPAVDVYAMGAILGEMLAGVLPDPGGEIPEISRLNPAIPPALEAAYRRSVNANPQARFTRASQLAGEVSSHVSREEEPSPTVPLPRPRPPTQPGGRSPSQPNLRPPTMPPARPPSFPQPSGKDTDPGRLRLPRRPPPPVPGGEIELSAGDAHAVLDVAIDDVRPPEPSNRPSRPRTMPPPVPVESEALPTQSLALNLPPAVDSDGNTSEEPTQAMQRGDFVPARPPSRSAIARPLPAAGEKSGPDLIWVLAALGAIAGIGGGWAFLQHQKRVAEESLTERQRVLAASLDAGSGEAGGTNGTSGASTTGAGTGGIAPVAIPTAGTTTGSTSIVAAIADAGAPPVVVDSGSTLAPIPTPTPTPTPTPVVATGGACPEGTVRIASGTFKMGSKADDPLMGWDEKEWATTKTAAYCIDLYEFPNQAGAAPRTLVAFAEAKQACEGVGKRLCSEEEWERACKGEKNSRFAYGDSKDARACHGQDKSPIASGSMASCKSSFGVFDLTGNVAEWTSSRYAPGAGGKAVKGAPGEALARCAGRRLVADSKKEPGLGFRCCRDASE